MHARFSSLTRRVSLPDCATSVCGTIRCERAKSIVLGVLCRGTLHVGNRLLTHQYTCLCWQETEIDIFVTKPHPLDKYVWLCLSFLHVVHYVWDFVCWIWHHFTCCIHTISAMNSLLNFLHPLFQKLEGYLPLKHSNLQTSFVGFFICDPLWQKVIYVTKIEFYIWLESAQHY